MKAKQLYPYPKNHVLQAQITLLISGVLLHFCLSTSSSFRNQLVPAMRIQYVRNILLHLKQKSVENWMVTLPPHKPKHWPEQSTSNL